MTFVCYKHISPYISVSTHVYFFKRKKKKCKLSYIFIYDRNVSFHSLKIQPHLQYLTFFWFVCDYTFVVSIAFDELKSEF